MKNLLLLSSLFFATHTFAVEIKFFGPCIETFIMKTTINDFDGSVGALTIHALKKFDIPHNGTDQILHSAFMTPVGDGAIENVSEGVTRFYGWCYSVDGQAPDVYPSEILVTEETKTVTWTFGYAELNRGEWTEQCAPAYRIKPKFLCQ